MANWKQPMTVRLNSRRLRYLWTPLLAAGLVILFCGMGWHAHSQAAARQERTLAQVDLDIISDSLKSFSADGSVAITPEVVQTLDARGLYELLSATNGGACFLGHQTDWDQHQELIDPWGRPFHIQVIPVCPAGATAGQPTAANVRIWSAGPNGQDEHGAGDDISCQMVAIRLRK